MSTNYQKQLTQSDPWREEGQIFRAVAVVVLILFAGFVFYDGKQSYIRYVKRCVEDPQRPDCAYWGAKPTATPEQWTILEQVNGRWAIQLEPMKAEIANENLNRLRQAGMKPRLIRITKRKAVVIYLQLGRFQTQKDALAVGNQLKERGFLQSFTISVFKPASN